MADTYELINTSTVATAYDGFLYFNDIPQTYDSLRLVFSWSSQYTDQDLRMQFNNNQEQSYYTRRFRQTSTTTQTMVNNNSSVLFIASGSSGLSAYPTVGYVDIMNYYLPNYFKTIMGFHGFTPGAGGGGSTQTGYNSGQWEDTPGTTPAISSIRLGLSFAAGDRFSLYGIKGA